MKIDMKEDMGIADEMTSSDLESRAQRVARKARTASFASTVTLIEATEGDENWHEGGDGHCRRNDIFGFGTSCAQRALLRAKRARRALRALLPC